MTCARHLPIVARLFPPARISEISVKLAPQLAGLDEGWTDPDTGTRFQCRDPELLQAVQAFDKRLSQAAAHEPQAIVGIEVDFLDMLDISTQKLSDFAQAMLGGTPPSDLDAVADWGLLTGILIDTLIIWLIAANVSDRREQGQLDGRISTWLAHPRNISPEARQAQSQMLKILHGLTTVDGRDEFFAVPLDGSPEHQAAAQSVAERLELPLDTITGGEIDLSAVDPRWTRARTQLHGNANWFRLYRITNRARAWRRQATRDLADTTSS